MPTGWNFDNTYARLPGVFHVPAAAAPFRSPKLVILNTRLAASLNLDPASLTAEVLSGQSIPEGAQPLAQAYAGHQFGHFTMLGDGRAILLGEHRAPDGRLVDIQFKGPGRTRFSRGGDGKAALGPMLREYVISEVMAALGIPTTRSLAVVQTGEPVLRETIQKGAILTRIAASHLRVGTFEYAANFHGPEAVRTLADYAIRRHYPETTGYLGFFRAVAERQASLLAQWQMVGFIHGVMNTDNMAISGETIDYGPCAFMNAYHPATVFSSIDRQGRYAYANQPSIAQWNLARLAEALLPLFDPDQEKAVALATEVLQGFAESFLRHWHDGLRRKLGLRTEDHELATALLQWMAATKADWTNTFRDLRTVADEAWRARWLAHDPDPALMRRTNPAIIPRNHRVVEALAAAEADDFAPLHALLAALATPYDDGPERYREPPTDESGYRTFCGT